MNKISQPPTGIREYEMHVPQWRIIKETWKEIKINKYEKYLCDQLQ
jgi:hypothetical protein